MYVLSTPLWTITLQVNLETWAEPKLLIHSQNSCTIAIIFCVWLSETQIIFINRTLAIFTKRVVHNLILPINFFLLNFLEFRVKGFSLPLRFYDNRVLTLSLWSKYCVTLNLGWTYLNKKWDLVGRRADTFTFPRMDSTEKTPLVCIAVHFEGNADPKYGRSLSLSAATDLLETFRYYIHLCG